MRISEIGLLDTQCWKVLCQKIAEENLFDFSFDSTLYFGHTGQNQIRSLLEDSFSKAKN